MDGVGKDYVLLAHVCGDAWLCHPGCPSGIFSMEQAVVLNVKADAWVEAARPRQRRRAQRRFEDDRPYRALAAGSY